MMNLYNGGNWWVGVIEDRKDPQKQGRCKVRIFGYHPEDTGTLSTDDLPWAILMTPATSASISGVGTSPVGILEGSWVVGFFMDGDDKQQPVIVGTVPGKPEREEEGNEGNAATEPLKNDKGQFVYDDNGNAVENTKQPNNGSPRDISSARAVRNTLPPLTVDDNRKLLDTLAENKKPNGVGKYGFTVDNLVKLGILRVPRNPASDEDVLNNPANWVNDKNIRSKEDLIANTKRQDELAAKLLDMTYDDLYASGKINDYTSKAETAGLLASSIRTGKTNYSQMNIKDEFGKPASEYYSMGAKQFGSGEVPKPASPDTNRQGNFGGNPQNPGNVPSGQLNDPSAAAKKGFEDPNKVYPTKEYTEKKLPDTNKLAAGDKTSNVLIYKKENRIEEIPIGYTKATWDEPESPYSAKYPHNQVIATESGHVIELDNTPGRERIQMWHKSNTYIEIDVNGTSVRKVTGDNYEIIEHNDYVYVKGAQKTTIEGVQRVLVKDSMYVQVMGDITVAGQSDIKINGAKKVNLTGTDEVKIQSAGPVEVRSDATITVQGGPRIDLNPGGGSNDFFKPDPMSPKENEPEPLQAPTTDAEDLDQETGEEGAEEYRAQRQTAGKIQDRAVTTRQEDSSQGKQVRGSPVDKTEFERSGGSLPDSFKMSKHYTLGALSNRAPASPTDIKSQRGLTSGEIAGNLKTLAVNVLDPIKDKYPEMKVTSAFRSGSSTSDHDIGAAADLQFTGRSPDEYYQIAQWIRDNVPHTQLLLEYQDKPDGSRIAWIHVAYKENAAKSNLPIGTMYNHQVYKRNGLAQIS